MLRRWFPGWSKGSVSGAITSTSTSASGQGQIQGQVTKSLPPVSNKPHAKRAQNSDVIAIKNEVEIESEADDNSSPRPAKIRKLTAHDLASTVPRSNMSSTYIDSDQYPRSHGPDLGENSSRDASPSRLSAPKVTRSTQQATSQQSRAPAVLSNNSPTDHGDTIVPSIEPVEESVAQEESRARGEWDFVKREFSEDQTTFQSESAEGTELDSDVPDEWRREQNLLSMVLRARNEFSMMPSTWKHHFLGIPIPEELFYRKVKAVSSRPRIYAHCDDYEFRLWRALAQIARDHADIRDLRRDQINIIRDSSVPGEIRQRELKATGNKMLKKVNAAFVEAIGVSRLDGDLEKYGDALPSNIHIIKISGAEASQNEIINAMTELAEEWRERFDQLREAVSGTEDTPLEPVIYGLAIMNHFVFVVTLDSSDRDARCHIPIKMDLTEHWQQWWNAIAVMATVCWARDKLMETAGDMKLQNLHKRNNETDVDA